jgi:hypothetical protein
VLDEGQGFIQSGKQLLAWTQKGAPGNGDQDSWRAPPPQGNGSAGPV